MADRRLLIAAHERVDRAVERGRVEQRLPGRGCAVEQGADRGEESHVRHAIGLVDDDDLHRAEVDFAALEEIGESPRTGDEHVDAAPERAKLRCVPGASVHGRDAEPASRAEPRELAAYLLGELARGHEHETGGLAGPRRGHAHRDRDAEREGLARAGRRATAEVEAGAAVRRW